LRRRRLDLGVEGVLDFAFAIRDCAGDLCTQRRYSRPCYRGGRNDFRDSPARGESVS
jgi:hypothetical protein